MSAALLSPFRHLRRLTDGGGLHEHAQLTVPRPEHGYCVDDVARALVVLCRSDDPLEDDLRAQYLSFVLDAQAEDGRFRNRRGPDRAWADEPTVEDCWGRALWGLGAVVRGAGDVRQSAPALVAFDRGARWRSPWSRAMAFGALGAADVLQSVPGHDGARTLLRAAGEALVPAQAGDRAWPWPEARLTYANAAVPEVLLAAGDALSDSRLTAAGLALLEWLLQVQTRGGHLSVVPVAGWGPRDVPGPEGFDQQPLEVAALADACARAHDLTGDGRWAAAVELCLQWFLGDNDAGTPLLDAESGGGCDGLERSGRNDNQGAESTLALLSTVQQSARLSAPLARAR